MSPTLVGEDPIGLFERWFEEAKVSELNDPNAVALATASHDAIPSVRMVLMKYFDASGFSFFTNARSQKGRELEENPKAALCFHWKSLRRQVRVCGHVVSLPDERVDEYFHSRARASQIASAVSQQSQPLPSRAVLEQQVAEFTQAHSEGDVPRPSHWRGYLLQPVSIEFWLDGASRLHERRRFERSGSGWTNGLLYP